MSELTVENVAEVWEACRAGAEEAGAALGRAWGGEFQVVVGEPASWDSSGWADDGNGALVIVMGVGGQGVLLVFPDGASLVPEWTASPDETGTSRLRTLGQELGASLLPAAYFPDRIAVGWVGDLAAALGAGRLAESAPMIPLEVRDAEGRRAAAHLVWPVDRPDDVLAGESGGAEGTGLSWASESDEGGRSSDGPPGSTPAVSIDDLPDYARSLLRVRVPVVVTLARKRQPLGRIVELGPGSIIQFDKSCEEMLELEVGGHPVAVGEAVKVGDKFGLRLQSIVLPEERFRTVRPGGGDCGSPGPGESLD